MVDRPEMLRNVILDEPEIPHLRKDQLWSSCFNWHCGLKKMCSIRRITVANALLC